MVTFVPNRSFSHLVIRMKFEIEIPTQTELIVSYSYGLSDDTKP